MKLMTRQNVDRNVLYKPEISPRFMLETWEEIFVQLRFQSNFNFQTEINDETFLDRKSSFSTVGHLKTDTKGLKD